MSDFVSIAETDGAPTGLMARARHRARKRVARYGHNADGAVTIEFAVVAMLFFVLLFAILELALIFFTNSVLAHAVSEAGRTIRVGQFQACGQAPEFRKLVCSRMNNLMDCEKNLRIDVRSAGRFQEIQLGDPGDGGVGNDEDRAVDNGEYDNTSAGDPVIVRGTFYYKLILPAELTRLENPAGSGRRVITASTAFRNEPFPDSNSCDPDLSGEVAG